ncbi:SAM-dependent methyltransferase [Streptosporangium becharense]|uniref:SAM-dependent methyltransferase n=1 Tax=Streptosporangium becharense TaxID=1816182 RepID=A0A7W9ILI9_9ACTN|nr:spermidine synthase [Streptosporangium becharense]MBB2910205.1 SAM-dependent methyltransferase [Streptosporangium becharense]MBB5822948.1 SAM-dependent methyltransferase [Streptosporangium becharense]
MTTAAETTPTPHSASRHGHWLSTRPRLVVASGFMLFLELALIRWTGSNIVHLSYFTNFVLLGSFLGIGLGFLRVGRTTRQPYYSPIVLAALVLVVLLFPVTVDRQTEGVLYWTSLSASGPPPWLILPVIFVAAAVVLMGPAELVGRCFPELDRLEAYRYDLIGSLTGIALFTALSFLSAPPVVWGGIAALAYAVLLWPRRPWARVALLLPSLVVVGALAVETLTAGALWSPYYKVTYVRGHWNDVPLMNIDVNGIPHQQATPARSRLEWERQYALPYERSATGRLDDVLIVGAGSGTDVSIALSKGARHVDAVEIDPKLLELGRRHHPDRPYDDPRVTTHVTDGRAFLERTSGRYDLILFALPDSLTLVSGASSLRLESYLFTSQAMEAAREHLKPGGSFSMYNYYREGWLVDRLASTVQSAFGHRPCVDIVSETGQQAVITAGLTPDAQRCGGEWAGATADTPPPAGDDRPFLYLKDRTIPQIYLLTLGLILIVSMLAVRAVAGPYARMRPYADLFLLGVAFLLLETKSVTGFALLFGTTWVVNAIVFAGVLVAVLAAVEVTRRFRVPSLPVMYGVLLAGLLLAWLVPNSWLLGLPLPVRAVVAVVVAFLPIFAANVVFAKRFAGSADGTVAFGANLLGAMVGGCLEYLALVVGYQALLVVAGVVYLGAFALLPRTARAG